MQKKIMVINGPNLNMLGQREIDIYGKVSLEEIQKNFQTLLNNQEEKTGKNSRNFYLDFFQSNIEGQLVSKIHEAHNQNFDFLLLNPGAFSHTSVAILDALKILKCLKCEIHISNTHARDSFRQRKLTAQGVDFIIEGMGTRGYQIALKSFLELSH